MVNQALILAGGLGTRLREIVDDRPKAMATLGDKPFLQYQIEFLRRHEVNEIVLAVGYRYEHIMRYFGDGNAWDVHIEYAVESTPLGTAGAIRNAGAGLRDRFWVLNGDSYFDIDLAEFRRRYRSYRESDARCLGALAVTEMAERRAYGSILLDRQHRIRSFHEKSPQVEGPAWINAGIYLLEKQILQFIPSGRKVSLEKETFPEVVTSEYTLYGYPASGFFVDIGTPAGYRKFEHYIREIRHDYPKQSAAPD